jgi:hypothetical protein
MGLEMENLNRDPAVAVIDEPNRAGVPAAPPDERMALFPEADISNFRQRWHDLQGTFVDEPRHAVEQANQLVGSVVNRLTQVFTDERNRLEADWGKGRDVSTEDLRQALKRYRSFFDRLLSV